MAEIAPGVYDILHPNPASLQELSAIAVSREMWRCKVNECRTSGTLKEFNPKQRDLSLKTILPDLPSAICNPVDEYIVKFGSSLYRWLTGLYDKVFHLQYRHSNYVLEDFDDFVCDFDGGIHFARTAERLMRCEQFNAESKFIIACSYFLEHDVGRIWPSVSSSRKMALNDPDNPKSMSLYYWICILRKKFHKLPTSRNGSVDEEMFEACAFHGPSVEYFWNRLPSVMRLRSAIKHCGLNRKSFLRFILPKLDAQQLAEFVKLKGRTLMRALVESYHYDEKLVFSTWMYIRNIMNESTFTNLVLDILKVETSELCPAGGYVPLNWLYFCCEIWNSAPDHLKRSAITCISSDVNLTLCSLPDEYDMYEHNSPEFLLHVLSQATSEEKRSFWLNCWLNLTLGYKLQCMEKIMEMCVENEDEIVQFKGKLATECALVRGEYGVGLPIN